jgi:hypothetical protein
LAFENRLGFLSQFDDLHMKYCMLGKLPKTRLQEVILPCPSLQMLSRKIPPVADEKSEIGQKFLISQPVSEIPPQPFKKRRAGGIYGRLLVRGKILSPAYASFNLLIIPETAPGQSFSATWNAS